MNNEYRSMQIRELQEFMSQYAKARTGLAQYEDQYGEQNKALLSELDEWTDRITNYLFTSEDIEGRTHRATVIDGSKQIVDFETMTWLLFKVVKDSYSLEYWDDDYAVARWARDGATIVAAMFGEEWYDPARESLHNRLRGWQFAEREKAVWYEVLEHGLQQFGEDRMRWQVNHGATDYTNEYVITYLADGDGAGIAQHEITISAGSLKDWMRTAEALGVCVQSVTLGSPIISDVLPELETVVDLHHRRISRRDQIPAGGFNAKACEVMVGEFVWSMFIKATLS